MVIVAFGFGIAAGLLLAIPLEIFKQWLERRGQ